MCVLAGVETATASTPAPSISARVSWLGTSGWSAATCSRRCGEEVTTPASVQPGAEAISGAWKTLPPKPYPTSPIRVVAIRAPLVRSCSASRQ